MQSGTSGLPLLSTRKSVSQRSSRSETTQLVRLRHVSNSPFPNRAGYFHSTRLSRNTAPPVLGLCDLHRTRWVLSALPSAPSPCPEHYTRRFGSSMPPP